MSSWPKIRLDSCAEIVSGATPSTSEKSYWDGEICWATPKDLSELDGAYISNTPRKITLRGLESCAATILPPGSVLFSSRAPIGHVAINMVPMATNQGFKSFIPNSYKLDSKFLYHWLRWNRPYLEQIGNGATFKEVSKSIVSQIKIPLPSLPEQRWIAAILDKVDELQDKHRFALKKIDELTQSIFLDMFGDPVMNPKGWPTVKLGDVSLLITKGESPKWQGYEYQADGALFITSENVRLGEIDLNSPKFIPIEFHNKLARSSLKKGDLLINLVGASIGRSCIFPGYHKPANINQAVATVRTAQNRVNPIFLSALLVSEHGQRLLLGNRVEAARANISLTDLRQLDVLNPPLELQRKFILCVEAMEKMRVLHQSALKKLNDLFASLQHHKFMEL